MSVLDRVKPGISRRVDFPLRRDKCALLIIDIQKSLSYPEQEYFHQIALPRAIKNIVTMAYQFRSVRDTPNSCGGGGCEVIFTYVQSSTKDGRDISLDYKLSGPIFANIPRIGDTDIFNDDCLPDPHTGRGDILLPKTSCSVFQSTNIDYMLRNLGIEQIVICGQLTDECVESAVRDGADLGYLMTVAEDACAAISLERHKLGLQGMQGFCRILKTSHITWEIAESVDAYRSENISLETITTFLKGRGFADAAIEVASSFAKNSGVHNNNNSSSSSSSPRFKSISPPTASPNEATGGGTSLHPDNASYDDVMTVSSAVHDNIVVQQQKVVTSKGSSSNKKLSPGIFQTSGSPKTPKAVSSSARNLIMMEQQTITPPTRNGSLVLPRYSNGTNNVLDRGRDPSAELIITTPDLNHHSVTTASGGGGGGGGGGIVGTSMTSSQYHIATQESLNSSSPHRTMPISVSSSIKYNKYSSQRKTNSLHTRKSIPVDLDDDDDSPLEQAKNVTRDPPAAEVTKELLEL